MNLKKSVSKKLLLIGLLLSVVGVFMTFIPLMNLYDSANACLEGSLNCDDVSKSTPIATAGGYLLVAGAMVFWVGIVRLVISIIRRKH